MMDEDTTNEKNFERSLPNIVVKDANLHKSWDKGKFTTYLICISTQHPSFHITMSAVRRRFSEVRWLHSVLKENHKSIPLPDPPSKHVWSNRFNERFIFRRQMEIQVYLNQLMSVDAVLSDSAYHLFIQTDLTIAEMEQYFKGEVKEEIVEAAWKNAGHIHGSSLIVHSSIITPQPMEIEMNEEDLLDVAAGGVFPTQTLGSREPSASSSTAGDDHPNNEDEGSKYVEKVKSGPSTKSKKKLKAKSISEKSSKNISEEDGDKEKLLKNEKSSSSNKKKSQANDKLTNKKRSENSFEEHVSSVWKLGVDLVEINGKMLNQNDPTDYAEIFAYQMRKELDFNEDLHNEPSFRSEPSLNNEPYFNNAPDFNNQHILNNDPNSNNQPYFKNEISFTNNSRLNIEPDFNNVPSLNNESDLNKEADLNNEDEHEASPQGHTKKKKVEPLRLSAIREEAHQFRL